jgi:hypothetical protein
VLTKEGFDDRFTRSDLDYENCDSDDGNVSLRRKWEWSTVLMTVICLTCVESEVRLQALTGLRQSTV